MSVRVAAVTVRAADAADDARLAEIDAATWSPAINPGPPPSADAFFRPGVHPEDTFVAVVANDVVGYVLLGHPTPLASSTHVQMIRGLAVAPEHQGTGVGQTLVDHAIAEATRRDARRLTLRVLGSNPGARRLYERAGFVVEGVLRGEFHLDGRDVDDVFMVRALVS